MMDIPKWAEWEGVYKQARLYLSKDRYVMIGSDGSTDVGNNNWGVGAWRDCGWKISEVNVCLEKK